MENPHSHRDFSPIPNLYRYFTQICPEFPTLSRQNAQNHYLLLQEENSVRRLKTKVFVPGSHSFQESQAKIS